MFINILLSTSRFSRVTSYLSFDIKCGHVTGCGQLNISKGNYITSWPKHLMAGVTLYCSRPPLHESWQLMLWSQCHKMVAPPPAGSLSDQQAEAHPLPCPGQVGWVKNEPSLWLIEVVGLFVTTTWPSPSWLIQPISPFPMAACQKQNLDLLLNWPCTSLHCWRNAQLWTHQGHDHSCTPKTSNQNKTMTQTGAPIGKLKLGPHQPRITERIPAFAQTSPSLPAPNTCQTLAQVQKRISGNTFKNPHQQTWHHREFIPLFPNKRDTLLLQGAALLIMQTLSQFVTAMRWSLKYSSYFFGFKKTKKIITRF